MSDKEIIALQKDLENLIKSLQEQKENQAKFYEEHKKEHKVILESLTKINETLLTYSFTFIKKESIFKYGKILGTITLFFITLWGFIKNT